MYAHRLSYSCLSLIGLSAILPGCFAPNFPATATDTENGSTTTGQIEGSSTISPPATTENESSGSTSDSGDNSTTAALTTTTGDETDTTGEETTGDTGTVRAVCGDSVVDGEEACDDGELNGVSGMSDCLSDCTLTTCGDGFLGTPATEECDQGEENADDAACTSECANATCGDNLVGPGEGCDDGPKGSDTCTSECALASCGDGTVQPPEECDDENEDNTDACLTTCVFASCGDGFVEAGEEQCDNGGDNSSDPVTCSYGTTEEECTYCETVTCSIQQGITSYCGDDIVQEDDGELCDGTYPNASCADCSAGISCDVGFDNCDGGLGNGCEIDIDNDAENCGACGHSCGEGGSCSSGVCETQQLAVGGFADIDFLETPDDSSCTASLWYLDTTAGSVSTMCLAGPLVGQPEGSVFTAAFLAEFYQAADSIAPAGPRFGYLTYGSNPDLFEAEVGTTATSLGRSSGYTGSAAPWGYYANIAATSHVTAAGSSPSALAFHRNEAFAQDYICVDAMDVPTAFPPSGTEFAACSSQTPFPVTHLVPVRFGGSATSTSALFFFANEDSEICIARGNAANDDTGVNPDPDADGGAADDIDSVDIGCTDISSLLGGPNVFVDGVGASQGRSAESAGQFFASSNGVGSIRLFETEEDSSSLALDYIGEVATNAQVEPLSKLFVPRENSDAGDGDDYVYWYSGQMIFRATRDIADTNVETLHAVPAAEGDLTEVWFYDGFIYYGTDTGIYRRALGES